MSRKVISVALEDGTRRRIKIACAQRGWPAAEFYDRAFSLGLQRLAEGGIWKLREVAGDAEHTSIWADGELAEELGEQVQCSKRVVFYTVIHDYLEELEEESV